MVPVIVFQYDNCFFTFKEIIGSSTFTCCRQCFLKYLYGVQPGTWASYVAVVKATKLAYMHRTDYAQACHDLNGNSAFDMRCKRKRSDRTEFHFKSVAEAKAYCKLNGMDFDMQSLRDMTGRDSVLYKVWRAWFDRNVQLRCNEQPNSPYRVLHGVGTREDFYKHYERDMLGIDPDLPDPDYCFDTVLYQLACSDGLVNVQPCAFGETCPYKHVFPPMADLTDLRRLKDRGRQLRQEVLTLKTFRKYWKEAYPDVVTKSHRAV